MEFFRIRKDIPFMRHALLLNAFSLLTFIAAVFFIWQKGLHLSIEFTGGTVMEITYPQTAPLDSIRDQITKIGYTDTQIQNFGSSRDVMIRLPLQKDQIGQIIPSADQSASVMKVLEANNSGAKLQRVEYVGPQVGKELAIDGLKALALNLEEDNVGAVLLGDSSQIKEGDTVKSSEMIADVETDKATMEFEAFYTGELLHIGIQEGGTAPVDTLLAIIGEKGEDISAHLNGELLLRKKKFLLLKK
mgnify:CR=1 FL=1